MSRFFGFNLHGTRRIIRGVRAFESHERIVIAFPAPGAAPFFAKLVAAATVNANNTSINAAQGLTGSNVLPTSLVDYTDNRYFFIRAFVNNGDSDTTTAISLTTPDATARDYFSSTVTNLSEIGTHNLDADTFALIFPADAYTSQGIPRFAMFTP